MASLGNRLSQNNEQHGARVESDRSRAAQERLDGVFRDERTIAGFFEDARKHFEKGILEGKAGSELGIKVGDPDYDEGLDPVDQRYQNVFKIIHREQLAAKKSHGGHHPAAFGVGGKYVKQWGVLEAWAKGEGLRVSWHEDFLNEDLTKSQLSLNISVDSYGSAAAPSPKS